MVFKFSANGTIRAKSKEDAVKKLKEELGEEFFNKHIIFGDSEEDIEQEVDVK
jgi:hydroxymethylpyrimidine pyrophosphatase-like HAD family hydrolase